MNYSTNTFDILQYNIQKSKTLVAAPLLADSAIAKFHVLAIQEPWRNPHSPTTYCPSSCNFYSSYLDSEHTRVAFYINKDIDPSTWTVENPSPDLAILRIEIQEPRDSISTIQKRVLTVYNVYNPCPESMTSTTSKTTLPLLDTELTKRGSTNSIILGDFNLHHPLWNGATRFTQHTAADELIDLSQKHELDLATPQGITTRNAHGAETTIDLAFTSVELTERIIKCHKRDDLEQQSDHYPIHTQLQLLTLPATPRKSRAWDKMDIALLRANIQKELRENQFGELDTKPRIDIAIEELHAILQRAIEAAVPWRKPTKWSKAWWTDGCRQAVVQARVARVYSSQSEYAQAKSTKKAIIHRAKAAYFRREIHEASRSNEKIWRLAKWARNKSHLPPERPQFPDLVDSQGRVATTFQEKAELLREKFFAPPPYADLTDTLDYQYPTPVQEQGEVTQEEIEDAIRSPAALKAPGPTGIINLVLQKALPIISAIITRILQACIRIGYHPTAFKKATTIVLKKPGKDDYTQAKSYRPIALLETIGKALETVVARRLTKLAEEHQLLPRHQMGARRGRDTTSALELITEQVYTIWGCGRKYVASMLSLDMAGAFDNASHPRLLHILKRTGIPPWIVNWTESFLTDRETTLSFPGGVSESKAVMNGIPQGSPISPILFLFYNEELVRRCNDNGKSSGIGFVDDVNILAWGESTESNCKKLSQVHDICADWAIRHGAAFAPQKYELIHLTRSPRRFNMAASIIVNECNIHPKAHIRILGLQIDTKLKWGPHLKNIEGKMAKQTLALSRLSASTWGTTLQKTKLIYTAVMRPSITYAAATWFESPPRQEEGVSPLRGNKNVVKKLQIAQNKCLRIITGAFKATPVQILEVEAGVPPILLHLEGIQIQTRLRLQASGQWALHQQACQRIRRQLRPRRGAQNRENITPGGRKLRWAAEAIQGLGTLESESTEETAQMRIGQLPVEERLSALTRIRKTREGRAIKGRLYRLWNTDWGPVASQRTLPTHRQEITKQDDKLYRGLSKAESSLAIQIRTEKIGLGAFLSKRKVPGWEPACVCGFPQQTAKHVIKYCPARSNRTLLYKMAATEDYKVLTTTTRGLKATSRWLMRQGILPQFELAAALLDPAEDSEARMEGLDKGGPNESARLPQGTVEERERVRAWNEQQLQARIDAGW
jgi:hypothetical protein